MDYTRKNIIRETEKAILVEVVTGWGDTTKEVWLPKSQIKEVEVRLKGTNIELTFIAYPAWLGEKNDIFQENIKNYEFI